MQSLDSLVVSDFVLSKSQKKPDFMLASGAGFGFNEVRSEEITNHLTIFSAWRVLLHKAALSRDHGIGRRESGNSPCAGRVHLSGPRSGRFRFL